MKWFTNFLKRDELIQKQSSQYARSLIEASVDPLVTISPEGKITDVNEATIKVTGVHREELIGTDFSNYFTEPEKAREGYQEVFAKGFVTNYPLTIRHRDGKLTDVLYNASVYKDIAGNVLGVFAAARDVTAQKQASQYARSLIEASVDPLVTISPEGKITDINEATIKITGVHREELIGTDFSNYFTEQEKAREGYQQVFAKGFVTDYPLTIRHRDSKLTDVLYNAAVYKDARGNVLGVFAAARDVTAQKQAEESMRKTYAELESLVQQVREGITVLGSGTSEILATTTQVAASSAETATAVSETTATVEEIRQTVQLTNQKAKQVSESAQRVAKASQTGRQAVEELIAGMERIREQTASTAESIVRLSEQSQVIGEIILTVNDLAEQSNLLAVNAAIEAAKAGEQGKGFAVVAQEIKSLAEQSKQATAQVRAILGDIQKATGAAVMATDLSGKAVTAGTQQSDAAGEAIHMLAESIVEAAQAALQIAASSQEQLVGMDQVALAMENIKQASTLNMSGTRQADTAAQNLHELGLKLKQLVERYKI